MARMEYLLQMSNAQKQLNAAIGYWLYKSINKLSVRKVSHRRHYLSCRPLISCAIAFREAGISLPQELGHLLRPNITTIQYANALALFYERWEQCSFGISTQKIRMPKGKTYVSWVTEGGGRKYYKAVHELEHLVNHNGAEFFLRAVVHGSVATLEDTRGFSDLDLAFVIKSEILKHPRKLLRLRELAVDILTLTYAFDPFMHHGPYYISEMDFACYPEAMFPLVLFGNSVDLLKNSQELEIRIRPSDEITDQQLDTFETFFRNWPSNPFSLKNCYELEWVLGSAMILPALYLQRKTGQFRYKRDTFLLASKDFSSEEWEPILTASKLRANLGPRPRPSKCLVYFARSLQCPRLLQTWACRHPKSFLRARQATNVLGADYTKRVLRFLKSARNKLSKLQRNGGESHGK